MVLRGGGGRAEVVAGPGVVRFVAHVDQGLGLLDLQGQVFALMILTAGGDLIVTVEDGSEEFPLDGAADAAKHLLQVCSPNG